MQMILLISSDDDLIPADANVLYAESADEDDG
jgi:hypothetical protein